MLLFEFCNAVTTVGAGSVAVQRLQDLRGEGAGDGAALCQCCGIQTRDQIAMLVIGGGLILAAGLYAPASFMSHFIVFVLSVYVGVQVIWNVSHSLHTPLMAVTNAISSIIILGALMQIGSGNWLVVILAALSVFMAGINIFGGFMVTRRMLAMFQKS